MKNRFSATFMGILVGLYLAFILSEYQEQLLNYKSLDLSQLGSFLGGIFSPIAFLFLIVQHFKQEDEVREMKKRTLDQDNEKIRLSKPDLKISTLSYVEQEITSTDPEKSYKSRTIRLKICNYFANASNVKAAIYQDNSPSKLYNVSPLIIFGEDKFHSFNIDDDVKERELNLMLTYLDTLGKNRNRRFKIKLREFEHFDDIYNKSISTASDTIEIVDEYGH